MSRTALPRDGNIVFDKRVTIPIALTLCGLVAGAGMGYATLHARVGHLERDSPKLAEINERTIRMEERIRFIAETVAKRP